MSEDDFLAAFEATSLNKAQWTHEAHVRLAWIYLTRNRFCKALEKVRQGIQRLNAEFQRLQSLLCIGVTESAEGSGYHDTITVAFVKVIATRIVPEEDFPTFQERNPDLFDRKLSVLHRHYSPERLASAEARQAYVEPDREPLSVRRVSSSQ